MKPKVVIVGHTVVGTFVTDQALFKCLKRLAPGCGARIKKGHKPRKAVTQKRDSMTQLGGMKITERVFYSQRKFAYLKRGAFTLD